MDKLKINLQLFAEPVQEYALANIARVDITTEAVPAVTYTLLDVATEAEVAAFISAGIDEELRVKNTIKAQNRTLDIVKGYNVTLTHATMIPEILALVDGGTWNPAAKKYSAPVVGTAVKRTKFTLSVYTEQKDADGGTIGYLKFVYKNCEGKPTDYSLVEGAFFVPTMTATSRPKFGESPVEFEILEELPA